MSCSWYSGTIGKCNFGELLYQYTSAHLLLFADVAYLDLSVYG